MKYSSEELLISLEELDYSSMEDEDLEIYLGKAIGQAVAIRAGKNYELIERSQKLLDRLVAIMRDRGYDQTAVENEIVIMMNHFV